MKFVIKNSFVTIAIAILLLFHISLNCHADLIGHWHADDYMLNSNWIDRVNGCTAEHHVDPLLSDSAFNGSKGVVFNYGDTFYIVPTNNPVVGATNFTVVALFKTATPGQNNNDRFWENSGIVGAEAPGSDVNDWALSILANGSMRAFFGRYCLTTTNIYVLDNKPHTTALTWSDTSYGGDGRMRFYVDGILQGTTEVNDYGNGIVNDGFAIARGQEYPSELRGFFQGTIGEVRMYNTIENPVDLHDALVNDNPNLIGHWHADDYIGSGNWLDRVSSISATVYGDPSVAPGSIGSTSCTNGIYFDGNDRFDISSSDNPATGETNFTVIVSFRTSTGGINNDSSWWLNTGIVGAESPSRPNDWGLMLLQNGSAKFAFGDPTYTDGNVIDGKLHTMALTWSDDDFGGDNVIRGYVDGVCKWVSSYDAGDGIMNDGFAIAAQLDGGTGYYTGNIGEVRIYNSIEDIAALHEKMTDDPALVGHWSAEDWDGSGNWLDRINNLAAVPGGTTTPVIVENAIFTTTSKDGIYFDGGSRFDILAADNPAVGATKFTVIALFRTESGGVNNSNEWYRNTGIISGEANDTVNDWGLMLLQSGNAKGAFGGNSYAVDSVIDNELHTFALTWSDKNLGGDAMMRLYIDGALKYTHHGHGSSDMGNGIHNFGFSIASEKYGGNKYYTGNIGEVRLYSQLKNIEFLHAEMTIPHPFPQGSILMLK